MGPGQHGGLDSLNRCAIDMAQWPPLRGTAATRLYAADLTEREIAETLGWSENRVEQLIKVYVNRSAIMRERANRISAQVRASGRKDGAR